MIHLLPLPMLGLGTPDVEALPSYLIRVGCAHGISSGHLMRHLLDPERKGVGLIAGIQAQPLAALVRPNATTEGVIQRAAGQVSATSIELAQGTFVRLAAALARASNTFSKSLRWCPGCFQSQVQDVGQAYFKLTWFLSAVHACSIHHLKLRDRCPTCHRLARPMNRWQRIDRCQSCESDLAKVSSDDQVVRNPEQTAPDLVQFVGEQSLRTAAFPAGGANRYVDQVFSTAWACEGELELWSKLPRDECIRYAEMSEPVTLAAARRIAYLLEVPIADLLDGGPPRVQCFGFAANSELPEPLKPRRRGAKAPAERIGNMLREEINAERPKSPRQLAEDLGTSVGAMRYHHPELLTQLSSAWRAGEARRLRSYELSAKDATFAAIANWRQISDRPLSRKSLLRNLMREMDIPKNVLREAIQRWWVQALTNETPPRRAAMPPPPTLPRNTVRRGRAVSARATATCEHTEQRCSLEASLARPAIAQLAQLVDSETGLTHAATDSTLAMLPAAQQVGPIEPTLHQPPIYIALLALSDLSRALGALIATIDAFAERLQAMLDARAAVSLLPEPLVEQLERIVQQQDSVVPTPPETRKANEDPQSCITPNDPPPAVD